MEPTPGLIFKNSSVSDTYFSFAYSALASRRKEFQSDGAMQPSVLGLINHSHAPTAQFFDDAVVRDDLPDHWRESYVREPIKSTKAGGYYDLRRFCSTIRSGLGNTAVAMKKL